MKFYFAIFLSLIAFAAIGAAIALWACSKRTWCPRYLRRQLDRWHKKIERRNTDRNAVEHIANELSSETPDPSNEGDAA
jgi:hypothetical protein